MLTHALSRPLVFAAACFTMASSAFAVETSGAFRNFYYTSDGTSATITGHLEIAVTTIDIPDSIFGVPVRTVASMAATPGGVNPPLTVRLNVTTINIPNTVTTIGASAFRNFSAVTSITLPDSVTSVGSNAFTNCSALTSVNLGNGVTSLDSAFAFCPKLATVDLPDQVVSLNGTFASCPELSSVQLPASLTSITGAFKNCPKLTSIELPAGLTAVGAETFSECTGLQNVVFPEGLVSIGDFAFRNCTGLTSVNLPSTLTMTGWGSFYGCTGLTSLNLPPALTTMGGETFYGCTGLTSVNLPPALTKIGDNSFYGCTGLTSLVIPPSLTSIGSGAFQGCTGLTSLVVPDSVKLIGDNAFWACENLNEFQLPPRFLASLANLGFDFKPQLASNALVSGLAGELTSSPAFVSALADAILAKSGNYGISTKEDITNVVNQTPQTVREVIAEMGSELPVAHGITSDLGTLTVKKGKEVQYAVSTTFTATSFAASGLPDGVTIHPTTGMITGKARKVGVYHAFLHAGVTGGGVVSAVKVFIVMP